MSFDKINGSVNIQEFNEMNFIKDEKPRNIEEESDPEIKELHKLIDGTYLDRLDDIQVVNIEGGKIGVVFSGYGGLVGFKIIDIN